MACHPIKGTIVSTERENTVPQSAFKLNSAPATAETLHLHGHVLRVNHNIMTTISLRYKLKLGGLSVCPSHAISMEKKCKSHISIQYLSPYKKYLYEKQNANVIYLAQHSK
jgi:hypothetical protein